MGIIDNKDIDRILKLINSIQYNEVNLEFDDLKLHFHKEAVASEPAASGGERKQQLSELATHSVTTAQSMPAVAAPAASNEFPDGVIVCAPMLGTFYRAPSPDEPNFVDLVAEIETDSRISFVEVMKLFNSIKASIKWTRNSGFSET